MAPRKHPRRWLFFPHELVPPVEESHFYRWATRPIVYQTFPAFIDGRVPVDGWQEIVRAASSMSGEYNIDHGGVILQDDDALLRALLDDYATQWFLKREGYFVLLSDQAIREGVVPPRQLFTGHCSDVQILDGRRASLEFEDILARWLDRTYPQYTLGDAYPYRFTEPDDTIDETLNTDDPGLQIPFNMRDQVLPIYYGPHVETRQDPITGVDHQQRMCPVFFMGYTHLTAGTGEVGEIPPELAAHMIPFGPAEGWGGWGELVVGLGEYQIPNVSVSDLADPTAGSPPSGVQPAPVILTEDRYGVDVIAPGHLNWPFATDYVMRNGYRLTVIYARGPVLWHHITNIAPINVDVCGWPDADGVMIDQAGFAWQDFLTQHVLAYDGAGYTSGPSLPDLITFNEAINDDVSMIWTSKIQDFQAMTAARLGTDAGYVISMALTKPVTLRELLRIFNVTFDTFTARNAFGQLYIFSIDDLASPDDGVAIRERIQLLTLPAPRIDWPAIENEIDYTVGYDPKLDAPRTITKTIRDQASIDALKGDVRKVDGIRNLFYTADDATSVDVMGRRLMRLRQPPRYQPLPLRIEGIDREIGEQVRVSHRDGFGANGVGYNLRPMLLLSSTHRGNNVTLEALDLGTTLVAAARFADESAPTWENATAEERIELGFWTEDDGTIPPDGVRGSEFR